MEDTASHEAVHELAHRADKANFSSFCDLTISDAMLSRSVPLFQFQVPSSTVLWFSVLWFCLRSSGAQVAGSTFQPMSY